MHNKYYFLSPEDTTIGPIPWAVLEQLYAAGTINDETLTAPEGASDWCRFHDLKNQQAHRQVSEIPRIQSQGPRSGLPGFAEEKDEWLRSLIPDHLLTKMHERRYASAILVAIIGLITLGGYSGFSLLNRDESSSADNESTTSRNPASSAWPQFNPYMSAQEINDLYARQGPSTQGATLNRGRGTTQESMDSAMQSAANAFGSRQPTGQTPQFFPQNKPAALSTYGTKPKRYRNFQGEVREFIGFPPNGGWTPINE
jgi:hypothetical protein